MFTSVAYTPGASGPPRSPISPHTTLAAYSNVLTGILPLCHRHPALHLADTVQQADAAVGADGSRHPPAPMRVSAGAATACPIACGSRCSTRIRVGCTGQI